MAARLQHTVMDALGNSPHDVLTGKAARVPIEKEMLVAGKHYNPRGKQPKGNDFPSVWCEWKWLWLSGVSLAILASFVSPATAETVVLRPGDPMRVMSDVTIDGSPYKNANSEYNPDGKGIYLEKDTRFEGSNLTINADLTGIQLLDGNNSVSLMGHNIISVTGVPQKGFGYDAGIDIRNGGTLDSNGTLDIRSYYYGFLLWGGGTVNLRGTTTITMGGDQGLGILISVPNFVNDPSYRDSVVRGENINIIGARVGIKVRSLTRSDVTINGLSTDISVKVVSPPTDLDRYIREIGPAKLINLMVGDLQRIAVYPSLGFQAQQEVPPEVFASYDRLVKAGFANHLIDAQRSEEPLKC